MAGAEARNAQAAPATLRLELFVADLPRSVDFYGRVLGFTQSVHHGDDYSPMRRGNVVIALNLLANLPDDHPIQVAAGERVGRGIEIVLEVDDVAASHAHARAEGWPVAGSLGRRPWGLTDFRVVDPDGYYVRMTSRH